MALTRKDFDLLAQVMRDAKGVCEGQGAESTRRFIAEQLAERLRGRDHGFNAPAFLDACKIASTCKGLTAS